MPTTSLRIFIVEDDDWYGKYLEHHMSKETDNAEIIWLKSGKELIDNLQLHPDLITLDFSLPDANGFELMKQIKEKSPNSTVVIVSAQEEISTALSLIKQGAHDYLEKNHHTKERLKIILDNIKTQESLKREVKKLRSAANNNFDFSEIIGKSSAMKKVFDLIKKASLSNITVSINGETGTGKELVARAIHFNSSQKKKPFVTVNIAAIPKDLIESELFGHEKGAFTGAHQMRIGKFEEADGGTLFLDEIGEMDIHLQAKLLRVLQEREITKIGGNKVIKFNTRIIVATHRNLEELVRTGKFREDLYYRIFGLPIELPPLSERENDVLIIAEDIIQQYCAQNDLGMLNLSPEAKSKIVQHKWPGNVRELKAVVELACILAEGESIYESNIRITNNNTISTLLGQEMTLKQYNYLILRSYLEKYDNNVLKVAKKLGIGKSTIYRMLKEPETNA